MKLLNILTLAILVSPSAAYAQIGATEPSAPPLLPEQAAPEGERIAPELPFMDVRPNDPNDLANDAIIIPYEPPPPQDYTHTYSPEHCEFSVAFPTEPFIQERCDGGENRDECYEQINYTQTFGIDATVGFRVICNKIGADIKDKYDQAVMVATLQEMTKKSVVNTFNTTFNAEKEGRYKVAGLVGEGKVGITPSMFVAQMWIGGNSALTIEAELIGEPLADADALFRDVLRSVYHKKTRAEADKEAKDAKEKETTPPSP